MSVIFKDLFIFEMANNHQGSVEHGMKIIKEIGKITRKYGIKGAIKFQYRDLDTFIHPEFKSRDDVKHIPRFLGTRLSDSEFQILIEGVRKENMITASTPFDENSVKKCIDHGIQLLKIASCSALDWSLLKVVAESRKPVIASTAGITIEDIDKIVSYFTHGEVDFALMHCVGIYPVPSDKVCLNFMGKMIKRYPYVMVGYSGHEAPDDNDVVKAAVTKGAKILERHVGVSTNEIKLNNYSMDPGQTDVWVESALLAKEICGSTDDKIITQGELESLRSLKRGVYAARDIDKGKVIEADDVFYAMPCIEDQVTSSEYGQLRTIFMASHTYKSNEPLIEHAQQDISIYIRNIIHDAKGMLYEANIELGKDVTIELSHQYKLENIRQTGAVIVNVINREYCKKIIIMLPAQNHPKHYHKKKEETFQLLWGDLTVKLEDREIKIRPGDKVLVKRMDSHSFSSINGAIFEEISTTSYKGDSFYEDEGITSMDPMHRKTTIEDW